MQKTGDEKIDRSMRQNALNVLTQGDALICAPNTDYQYKTRKCFDVRAHPAVLACGSDMQRANAMTACCTQVLVDHKHRMLSPLLAANIMQTLHASVGLRTSTCAPIGIPTIKQTPKLKPEQLLELMHSDLRRQWELALGIPAAPDWSRQENEQGSSMQHSNYTHKKILTELQLAMAANTQTRDASGALIL